MSDRQSEPRLDETLALAARGDESAWRALVEMYSRRVYALVVRQCGDRELAQEITQATFVRVVTKIGEYQEKGKFEPWLFRIAMNLLRDEMRRRKRHAKPMDMSGSGRGDATEGGAWAAAEGRAAEQGDGLGASRTEQPFDAVSRAEQVERLRAAIRTLSPADQEILALRHTAGLSFAEIAQTLDEPLGTVLARGHRALAKLKKLMESKEE